MLPSEEAKANGSQAGADWIAAEKAADGAAPIEKGARARLRVLATVARLPANRAPASSTLPLTAAALAKCIPTTHTFRYYRWITNVTSYTNSQICDENAPDTHANTSTSTHEQSTPQQIRTRTHDMARKILGVTCTKSANTKAMRAPLEEEVSEPPGNVPIGTGTGWRSLRKICTALGAVSHVLPEVCKGREAAHLLLEDADMVVRAVRMQEARLATPCSRSGLLQSTSGIVILRPPRGLCVGAPGRGWLWASGGT